MAESGTKWWGQDGGMMFTGEYNHTIDTKGRLIVPSKLRDILGDEFIVTKGLDGCLFVYPNNEWKIFADKLASLPITNTNARKFTRFFLSGAANCEVDKQGRILLPSPLREFAGLEKEVVFVGVSNRAEIWSKEKWEANTYDDVEEVAEHMADFGLNI